MIVIWKPVKKQKTYLTKRIIKLAARSNVAERKHLEEHLAKEEKERQDWHKGTQQKLDKEKKVFQEGLQKKLEVMKQVLQNQLEHEKQLFQKKLEKDKKYFQKKIEKEKIELEEIHEKEKKNL